VYQNIFQPSNSKPYAIFKITAEVNIDQRTMLKALGMFDVDFYILTLSSFGRVTVASTRLIMDRSQSQEADRAVVLFLSSSPLYPPNLG